MLFFNIKLQFLNPKFCCSPATIPQELHLTDLDGMSQEEDTGGPGQFMCLVSINQEHGGRHSVIEVVGAGWFL